jgi:type IV pilus assembly protein PilQ
MIYYKFRSPIRILVISLLTAGIFACAPRTVQEKSAEKPPAPKQILSLTTQEDADGFYIQVNASGLLTFKSVKQPSPLAVILYFSETVVATPTKEYNIDNDMVGTIRFSKMAAEGPASRMEISLKQDVPYEVARNGNELRISFNRSVQAVSKPAEKMVKAEPAADSGDRSAAPARMFKSLSTQTLENGVEISVKADGMIKDYHSFAVDSPARIVFDMFNLKSPQKKEKELSLGTQWVERVRYYGYPDRLRIVVETQKSYLESYNVLPVGDGLIIRITGSGEAVSKAPDVPQEKAKAATPAPTAPGGAAKAEKTVSDSRPSKPAWVNRIDFSSESEGRSAIIIGTTRSVQYDLKKISDKKLQLQLFDTRLPDFRQRPLITTRFESAVDRVTPFHSKALKNTALVSIELRESVPYLVEQKNDVLQIRFEASSIPPRPLDQAELPKWQQAMAEATRKEPAAEPAGIRSEQKSETPETSPVSAPPAAETQTTEAAPPAEAETPMPPGKSKKRYTGQKIALDFYETDIKNVFRILREVSGKNFAVDPDVSGKVTISLSDPVPWDAVLDLVLGMNGLAKVEEAGIIRIARRDTVAAESAAQQAAAAAQLQAKEQEKALEPLMTVYIPINYVNAEADVLPHLVLTPDRGSATVDARNNQIILTDTAEMIEMARTTIQEIDQVTPQVLIEGRIVEASNSFSRDLGAKLSVQITDIFTKELGNGIIPEGKTDLNMSAANPPTQEPLGQIGFDFTKLTGTPLKISATLLAAESEGQIKIISSPKVLTLDNRTARIRQGTQVPIPRLDDSGNTVIEYKDVDLELEVTPHVTPDKRITMEIKITNNDIGEEINGQTSFTTKEATTELLVSDGETVVIGGIRKSRRDESESGVPGLMKVPMLGWLFKSQQKAERLQELLIFITPRIVQLEQRNKVPSLSSSTPTVQ